MGDYFWIRFMMMKSLQNIGLVVLLLAEEETSEDKEKNNKKQHVALNHGFKAGKKSVYHNLFEEFLVI